MSEFDLAKALQQLQPKAFKVLAKIAYNPNAKARDRAKALSSLKRHIPKLRALCRDPSLSADEKRDLTALLEKLTG